LDDAANGYCKLSRAVGGTSSSNLGRRAEALRHIERGVAMKRRLAAQDPNQRATLVEWLGFLTNERREMRDPAWAIVAAQEAAALSEQGGPPVAPERINALGILYVQWGRALADSGDMPAAIDSGDGQLSIGLLADSTVTYRRAIQTIDEGLANAPPQDRLPLRGLRGVTWAGLAEALDNNLGPDLGDPDGALAARRASIAVWQELIQEDPTNRNPKMALAVSRSEMSVTLCKRDPRGAVELARFARARLRLAMALESAGDPGAAKREAAAAWAGRFKGSGDLGARFLAGKALVAQGWRGVGRGRGVVAELDGERFAAD
ncbi:MAG: hypothetical protein NTV52_01830, partial [Acidobacteria bacterium]|nr:hypothetical protein [Acidobacteriota bacterium]